MHIHKNKFRRGLTLMEILLSTGISMVFLALFVITMGIINDYRRENKLVQEIHYIVDFVHQRYAMVPDYSSISTDSQSYGNNGTGFSKQYWSTANSSIIDSFNNDMQLWSGTDNGKAVFYVNVNNMKTSSCVALISHDLGDSLMRWQIGSTYIPRTSTFNVIPPNDALSYCADGGGFVGLEFV